MSRVSTTATTTAIAPKGLRLGTGDWGLGLGTKAWDVDRDVGKDEDDGQERDWWIATETGRVAPGMPRKRFLSVRAEGLGRGRGVRGEGCGATPVGQDRDWGVG